MDVCCVGCGGESNGIEIETGMAVGPLATNLQKVVLTSSSLPSSLRCIFVAISESTAKVHIHCACWHSFTVDDNSMETFLM